MFNVLFTGIIREIRSSKQEKKEREKELAESLARQQREQEKAERREAQNQQLLSIYKKVVADLPLRESTKTYIAVKAVSILNDGQKQNIVNRYDNGETITLPLTKDELKKLDKEADAYIAKLEAEEQEKQWQQILKTFQNTNKAQQALLLEHFEKKGLDEDYLFTLKMIHLKDNANDNEEMTDYMVGNTKLFSTRKRKG